MSQRTWQDIIKEEQEKTYFQALMQVVAEEYRARVCYPEQSKIFHALELTPLHNVKVVILGQDPYINKDQAMGMSFSVPVGVTKPPSLRNIFKEIQTDVGCGLPINGDLTYWAQQGVLLLNTVMTVRAGESNSHRNLGWEKFTAEIIRNIEDYQPERVVYLLWGKQAQQLYDLVYNDNHRCLQAAHPSPLARGAFFGCKHFSKANKLLEEAGLTPIDWQIQ